MALDMLCPTLTRNPHSALGKVFGLGARAHSSGSDLGLVRTRAEPDAQGG